MRVLLCGGGTGGHVMPAIAIGEIIERHFEGAVVAFAGRRGGDENKAYDESGHTLFTVDICGIKRSLSINNIKSVFKIIKSGRTAREIINDFEPDIIIGTGGYVCYPFIRQGQRLGIHTLIHESNVSPGLVTRVLGKKCDKVMLNLEGTRKHLKCIENTAVVGNPTRTAFGAVSKIAARRRLGIRDNEMLVVSFGGSLGADVLNKVCGEVMSKYASESENIRYVHSTGRAHYENIKNTFPELFGNRKNVKILPYIDDMPLYLTAADLAITRSGAITVSELCRSGTPSILIPSPNVTANHQYANAAYIRDLGAASLIEEKDLDAKVLKGEIDRIFHDKELMKKMGRRARSAYKKDSEDAVVDVIARVLKRG